MLKDDKLVIGLMHLLAQDNFEYVFDILLECSDVTSRLYIGQLMKFLLNRLKVLEKDYPEATEEGKEAPSLSAKYITLALSILKTKASKNWSKFDQFLDTIYSFAVETFHDQFLKTPHNIELLSEFPVDPEDKKLGIEFLAQNKFIEKACDWMLGRKSPLLEPNEKRIEMGGYNSPNFTAFIKLITEMVSN